MQREDELKTEAFRLLERILKDNRIPPAKKYAALRSIRERLDVVMDEVDRSMDSMDTVEKDLVTDP